MSEALTVKLGDAASIPPRIEAPAPFEDPLQSLDPPSDRRLADLTLELGRLAVGAPVHLTGHAGASVAYVAARLARAGRAVVIVAADGDESAAIAQDLSFFVARELIAELPAPEATVYAEVAPDRRASMQRVAALSAVGTGRARVVVAPAAALVQRTIPATALSAATVTVAVDTELDRDAVAAALVAGGYLRVPVVEDPGSFAVRGGLLDVWPPSSREPVRIELYGDLVLSMRSFDPDGQRTLGELREIVLPPSREAVLTDATIARARGAVGELCDALDFPSREARRLLDEVLSGRPFFGADAFLPAFYELESLTAHLPHDAVIVLSEPAAVACAVRDALGRALADEAARDGTPRFARDASYVTEPELADALLTRPIVVCSRAAVAGESPDDEDLDRLARVPEDSPTLDARTHQDLGRAVALARQTKGKASTLAPLVRRLAHFDEHGLSVVIAARAETQAERLVALLRHAGVECKVQARGFDLGAPTVRGVVVTTGSLGRGAVLPGEGRVFLTEEEIFGARAHRAPRRERKQKTARAFLDDLRKLEAGDFVVHVEHGIGRYHGLVHRDVGGHVVDLLAVEYAGGDKLYLPVYRLNQLQKFSGGEGAPKLDRLGGASFSRTKAKVEKQVRQMADELLRLYAERRAVPGHALPAPDDEYAAFEATFAFDETQDQSRAIADVLGDLSRDRPMDRLVCGDVGFGKTEVAVRAAFRVAMAHKQVAVLCPTTVLAQQHFLSFSARFGDYPLKVAALSRFQTKQEQDAVVRGVKDGTVDVVVGTHRLLSKDIHWKQLGLLVVDEEQRFGVAHKERIKQLKTSVDVLTLTATPIPRTLQMAVTGLRDMSLITTAPIDRRAIRTIITRHDPSVIKEAVARELSRGGQIFYVYNRVEGLYERAAQLQALVPSARIAVAHGQMSEAALESAMLDFVDGKFDILCATAIIESGLDIPRANTMIIDRADMFGLAQLYQLRGRVGRSRERAYCYLVVPPESQMTDESRARIEALERHSELGAGFQIASLDMELRGAGDLLGAEQSGAAATVGFDLFCQMLDEAVAQLRGEEIVHEVEPDLSFDVDALLPEAYIDDVGVRLSLYKRLASAVDEAEVGELAAEMEDRFGPPPTEAKNLVELMRLKTELRRLRVLGCEASARLVTLHLRQDTPLDPAKVMQLVGKRGSPFKLTPDMRLSRRFAEGDRVNGLTAADALLGELAALGK